MCTCHISLAGQTLTRVRVWPARLVSYSKNMKASTIVSWKSPHGQSTLQVYQRGRWALYQVLLHLSMPMSCLQQLHALEAIIGLTIMYRGAASEFEVKSWRHKKLEVDLTLKGHLSCSLDSSRLRWWSTSFCKGIVLHPVQWRFIANNELGCKWNPFCDCIFVQKRGVILTIFM